MASISPYLEVSLLACGVYWPREVYRLKLLRNHTTGFIKLLTNMIRNYNGRGELISWSINNMTASATG